MTERNITTKERIMEVAGEIFGKEGFKAATIRKISEAADANVAAINYYFRDKEGLYAAVLEDLFESSFKRFPSDMGVGQNSPPEERLKAFIKGMFLRIFSIDGLGGISGKGRVIAKELMEPTPAFESVIEKYIKPHKEILISILSDLTESNMGKELYSTIEPTTKINILLPCALSIIGQCIYYAFATPVIQKIAGDLIPIEKNLDHLANHVWLFSLGGIREIIQIITLEMNEI